MAEFKAARGLNELAAKLVVDQISRIAKEVADAAKVNAPASKTWKSQQDALVRKTHVKANGQEVPENVRFQVETPQYDREHYDAHAYQLMRYPHDEENATIGNLANCRCYALMDPEAVANAVKAAQAIQSGTKVSANITVKFNRIEESEYGANGEPGIRFMGRALQEIAAKHRQ